MPERALVVERVTVRADRAIFEVRVPNPALRTTTSCLAARVQGAFPLVGHHACLNGEGPTFAAVASHTSLPHLLEHLVIDIQMRDVPEPSSDFAFVGTTEWTSERQGLARVEVSFADDLAVLQALQEAVRFINDAAASPSAT